MQSEHNGVGGEHTCIQLIIPILDGWEVCSALTLLQFELSELQFNPLLHKPSQGGFNILVHVQETWGPKHPSKNYIFGLDVRPKHDAWFMNLGGVICLSCNRQDFARKWCHINPNAISLMLLHWTLTFGSKLLFLTNKISRCKACLIFEHFSYHQHVVRQFGTLMLKCYTI